MKRHFNFITTLFLIFVCGSIIYGQETTPQVNSSNTANVFDFHLTSLGKIANYTPPLIPPYLDKPRYDVFWIFGDGTFLKYEDDVFEIDQDLGNLSQCQNAAGGDITGIDTCRQSYIIKHRYRENSSYQVTAYLTEKYSNDKPPEKTTPRTITAPIDDPGASFSPIIPVDRLIELDTNHAPRRKYETVHIISVKVNPAPTNPPVSGEIYFFYGSKINLVGPRTPIKDAFTYMRTHLADYYNNNGERIFGVDPTDPTQRLMTAAEFDSFGEYGANNTNFASEYDSVAILSFQSTEADGAFDKGHDEMRIFHITSTEPRITNDSDKAGNDHDPRFNFLAMVGYNNQEDLPPYDTSEVDILTNNHWNPGTTAGLMGSGINIADAREETYTVVSAHDPNKLCLYNICKCCENCYEDCEDECYLYYFSMTICNDRVGDATTIDIKFEDNYGFNCVDFQPMGKHLGSDETFAWDSYLASPKTFTSFPTGYVRIPAILPGVEAPYSPQCLTIYITAKSERFEPQKLCDTFLMGSVVFNGGPDTAIFNGELCNDDFDWCKEPHRMLYSYDPPLCDRPEAPSGRFFSFFMPVHDPCDCMDWPEYIGRQLQNRWSYAGGALALGLVAFYIGRRTKKRIRPKINPKENK